MKTLLACISLTACCLAEPSDLSKLSWMAGCWATSGGATTIEEHWSKPAAGQMLGYSRTLKGERIIFFEFMRLESTSEGVIYTPRFGTPQKPVPFRLTTLAGTSAVFENPEHDFPKKILYRRNGDLLHARVEGTRSGSQRAEDFPYRRVSCD